MQQLTLMPPTFQLARYLVLSQQPFIFDVEARGERSDEPTKSGLKAFQPGLLP